MACEYCLSTFTVEEVEAYNKQVEQPPAQTGATSEAVATADAEETLETPGTPATPDAAILPDEPTLPAAPILPDAEASEPEAGASSTSITYQEAATSGRGGHWEVNAGSTLNAEEQSALTLLACNHCGAYIEESAEVISTKCGYCNNTLVAISRIEATRVPDYIIPFKVGREQMVQAFQNASRGRPLLPPQFRDAAVIREAVGMYVPFWLYDGQAKGSASITAESIHTERTANQKTVTTQTFQIEREGSVEFRGIPVCASLHLPRQRAEAAEPFDMSALVPFKTAYLAGYSATSFTIPSKDTNALGEERAIATLRDFLVSNLSYSNHTVDAINVQFTQGRVHYVMLPIWLLNIEYQGTLHQFTINGQTGEVVGEFPISTQRLRRLRLKYFATGLLGGSVITDSIIQIAQM